MAITEDRKRELGMLELSEEALEAVRAVAVANYANDDLEIDSEPEIATTDSKSGYWVAAWVWVGVDEVGEIGPEPESLSTSELIEGFKTIREGRAI